jgi:hypothetical protein
MWMFLGIHIGNILSSIHPVTLTHTLRTLLGRGQYENVSWGPVRDEIMLSTIFAYIAIHGVKVWSTLRWTTSIRLSQFRSSVVWIVLLWPVLTVTIPIWFSWFYQLLTHVKCTFEQKRIWTKMVRTRSPLTITGDQSTVPSRTTSQRRVEDECCICRDSFDDLPMELTTTVETVGCFHSFHRDCLREWIVRHTSCPTCRASLL